MKHLNFYLSGSLSFLFLYLGFYFINNYDSSPPAGGDLPYYQSGEGQWFQMKADAHLTTNQLLAQYSRNLGLGVGDRWIPLRSDTDEMGMTHHRFQLHHNDIPVSAAQLLVHEKEGLVKTFNGRWVENLEVTGTVAISKSVAINLAMEIAPADQYSWENHGAEAMHKHAHHDHEATFYPDPELVYYNANFNNDRSEYRLAYSMILTAEEPIFRKQIVLDASTGALIHELDIMCTSNVPAVAETKYHGTVTIMTDSIAPDSFVLRETTRGFGIETYNNNNPNMDTIITGNGTELVVAVFSDTDNYWNTVNAAQDEVANDAHYSAQVTFDLFAQNHNYIGIDGDSMAYINRVHVGNGLVNAFWNGSWASYGDGSGTWTPLTSLDVVGHEFTHGITGNTAGLIYMNESGALNESFSDIFGTLVEFRGDPATADYLIGEDFDGASDGFRNMLNPNADGHPDTYHGDFWEFGAIDNGGVHINSGVQNFWFYLLAEGGSGTNDDNFNYNVMPLGQDTAALIAVRNLRYYLTESSNFLDARRGAVLSAEDMFGECSFQSEQTKNAWRAVGVGNETDDNDFEMLRVIDPIGKTCGLSANEFPTVEFTYKGCQVPLSAGTEVPIAIQVNSGPVFMDTFLLVNTLVGGDTMMYTFTSPVDGLQGIGEHVLDAWMAFDSDPNPGNNLASVIVSNVFNQNTDFTSAKMLEPVSACFMGGVDVQIQMTFLGCDSIAAGEELQLYYTADGINIVNESTTLAQTYYREDEFTYTFITPLDQTNELGLSDVTAWVKYAPDFVTANDSTSTQVVHPLHMKFDNIVTFEAGLSSQDSFYLNHTEYTEGFISELSAFSGNYGYRMQGGDVQEAWEAGILVRPDSFNVWNVNEELSTKLCHCVDGTNMTEIELSFDLRQRYSYFFLANTGDDSKMTSAFRVLIENDQISGDFFPVTHIFEPWQHLVYDVSSYAGTKFEVCFETRNWTNPETADVGDYAQIDNVLISGVGVSTDETAANIFEMELTPNPNTGILNIAFRHEALEHVQLEVFDVHGRLLKQKEVQSHAGRNTLRLDINDFSQGLYYVRMSSGAKGQVEPVVKL